MNILKVKLLRWEKALIFQVLEMDERFRATDYDHEQVFRASNGIKILSGGNSPFLDSHDVWLRGYKTDSDLQATVLQTDSNEERDQIFNSVTLALSEWQRYWEPGVSSSPL